MDTISALQLATSAVALLCSGVSLGTWFFFVTRLRSPRIILQKPILLSQAGIGFLHVAGTFLLLILSIYRPLYKQDLSRPISTFTIGVLLMLPIIHEYLCLSNLRPWLMIGVALPLLVVNLLAVLLFFADSISPTYRHLLYSGHLVLISSEGLLTSVVYFNVWVEAVSLPVQSEMIHGGVYYPRTKTYLGIIQMFALGLGATFSRDQRGLRTASIAAGLLSLVSMVLVILGCLEEPLWISLATLQVTVFSLSKIFLPLGLSEKVPRNHPGRYFNWCGP